MALTEAQVRHVARLARIDLTDEEVAGLGEDLSDILAYAEKIGEVATEDVSPTTHPYPLANVHRADEPKATLPPEEALKGAPQAEDGRFRVPRIVGEEA